MKLAEFMQKRLWRGKKKNHEKQVYKRNKRGCHDDDGGGGINDDLCVYLDV